MNLTFKLNNGNEIPVMALGSWDSHGNEAYQACMDAFLAGYRHIDTASYYGNESFVGAAIRDCKIPREEIFVTSKMWYEDMVDGKQEAAFEKTLQELGLEYLDMYLLHWPINDAAESWKVLEKYYEQGLIKNIGVSNFRPKHLKQLEVTANIAPAVNQIEICPFLVQEETVNYCRERDIVVEAWGPLGKGRQLSEPEILTLAKKYNKTPAQIILRWHFQRRIVSLPKSIHKERIIENADIFDFELSKEDMQIIASMNLRKSTGRGYPAEYEY